MINYEHRRRKLLSLDLSHASELDSDGPVRPHRQSSAVAVPRGKQAAAVEEVVAAAPSEATTNGGSTGRAGGDQIRSAAGSFFLFSLEGLLIYSSC